MSYESNNNSSKIAARITKIKYYIVLNAMIVHLTRTNNNICTLVLNIYKFLN